ncbi:hypothetical protein [Paenibacillus apii]|uniref:hypothetical protein n=1 Tax=Paenibacillus apii TaxID=1850370 RepID=UPI00143B29C6|nr:hypothetical protein [Paenibacillus apii]NJJ38919.1 hypothetical protein [Paenibacillus apii]
MGVSLVQQSTTGGKILNWTQSIACSRLVTEIDMPHFILSRAGPGENALHGNRLIIFSLIAILSDWSHLSVVIFIYSYPNIDAANPL